MPPGFLALDMAGALGMPLFDPDRGNAPVPAGAYPSRGNGLIGAKAEQPDIVVAANGAPITGPEQLLGALRKSGQTLKLTVRDSRTGRDTEVAVNLGGTKPAAPAEAEPGGHGDRPAHLGEETRCPLTVRASRSRS